MVRTDPKLIHLMESKHLCDMYMKVCKAMKQFQRTGSDDDAKKLLHGTYIKWCEVVKIVPLIHYHHYSLGPNQCYIYSLERSVLITKTA